MKVYIPDIKHVIYQKIVDHSTLATIFQQIRYTAQRIEIQAVAVIFRESKYILPKNITSVAEDYFFAHLLVIKGGKTAIDWIVLSMYKDNMQMSKEGDLSAFHKIDPPLLWFLNTISYCRQLALAYFADDSAYQNLALQIFFCNNCLYYLYKSANAKNDSGVPGWELYNVIMRHSLYYMKTNKLHRHKENIAIAEKIDIRTARFALKESDQSYKHNLIGLTKITAERAAIAKQRIENCKKVSRKTLDSFAIRIWSDGIDDIIFSFKQKVKLSKRMVFIKLVTDIIKTLKTDCNLLASGIQNKIYFIFEVILLAVEDQDCEIEIAIYQDLVSIADRNVDVPQ